ncbi:MAG: hypothetical protein ACPGE9_04735, partial [Algiphilus sp.]
MPGYTRRRFLRDAAVGGVYLQSGWLLGCSDQGGVGTPAAPGCRPGLRSNIGNLGPLGEPDRFGVRVPPGLFALVLSRCAALCGEATAIWRHDLITVAAGQAAAAAAAAAG